MRVKINVKKIDLQSEYAFHGSYLPVIDFTMCTYVNNVL